MGYQVQMTEWLNARVCKTRSRKGYAGSNPALYTINKNMNKIINYFGDACKYIIGMQSKEKKKEIKEATKEEDLDSRIYYAKLKNKYSIKL